MTTFTPNLPPFNSLGASGSCGHNILSPALTLVLILSIRVSNFNDPYDCLVTVDCGLKASYPKSQRKEAMETYMRRETENRKTEALRSSLFLACFSEVNNSFPMWGYYAADHKGICLGWLYDYATT